MNKNFNFFPSVLNVYHSDFALRSGLRTDVGNRQFISGSGNIVYIDFLNRIYKESFKHRKKQERFISGAGLFLFIKKIIEDVANKINFNRKIQDGFINLLIKTLYEIKEAGISPLEFRNSINKIIDYDGVKKDMVLLLSKIYLKYEEELKKKKFFDVSDQKIRISEILEINDRIPFLYNLQKNGLHKIEFKNIFFINELDFRIIKSLAKYMEKYDGEVVFNIPYNADRQEAFRCLETRIRSFESLGEYVPNLTLNFDLTSFSPNKILNKKSFVTDNLFRNFKAPKNNIYDYNNDLTGAFPEELKSEEDDSVEIFRSDTPEKELDSVFRRIRKFMNDGISPSSIALISNNPDSIRNFVKDKSKKYSVPIVFSQGTLLSLLPVIDFLSIPVDILIEGLKSDLIAKLLSSPFFNIDFFMKQDIRDLEKVCKTDDNLPNSFEESFICEERDIIKLTSNDIFSIKEEALTFGNNSTFIEVLNIFLQKKAISEEKNLDLIKNERLKNILSFESQKFLKKIEYFYKVCKKLEHIFHFINSLDRLTLTELLPSILKHLALMFDTENMIIKNRDFDSIDGLFFMNENLEALEKFYLATQKVCAGFGIIDKKSFNFETFRTLLKDYISDVNLTVGMQNEGVSILSPSEAIERNFSTIFITGLCEGVFPSFVAENICLNDKTKFYLSSILPKYHKDPIKNDRIKAIENLDDYEKGLIEEVLRVSPFFTSKMEYWKQAFLFLVCISKASDRVIFSFSEKTGAGVNTAHSYYLDEILSFFGISDISQCDDKIEKSIMSVDDIFDRSLDINESNQIDKILLEKSPDLYYLFEKISKKSDSENSRDEFLKDKFNGEYSGIIKDGVHYRKFSPSSLEDYVRCPFRYFAKHILNIHSSCFISKAKNLGVGNALHLVLQKYYTQVKPNQGFVREVFNESASEAFGEIDKEFSLGVPEFIKYTEESIKEMAENWITNDSEALFFNDVMTEFEIPDNFYLNLMVNGQIKRYYFTGRIDRMDLNSSAFRIVDYKSGKTTSYSAKVKKDPKYALQAPIYTIAMKHVYPNLTGKFVYAFLGDSEAILPECFSYTDKKADIWENYFCEDFRIIQRLFNENKDRRFLLKDLSEIVEGIENGLFGPTPTNLNCDSCEYFSLCRKSLEDM